jgi:hypothetical protein
MADREQVLPHERMAALAELRRIERVLAQMAPWLDKHRQERVAVLLEDAWRDVCAAQHLLDRDPAQVKRLVPDGRALSAG